MATCGGAGFSGYAALAHSEQSSRSSAEQRALVEKMKADGTFPERSPGPISKRSMLAARFGIKQNKGNPSTTAQSSKQDAPRESTSFDDERDEKSDAKAVETVSEAEMGKAVETVFEAKMGECQTRKLWRRLRGNSTGDDVVH